MSLSDYYYHVKEFRVFNERREPSANLVTDERVEFEK